MNRFWTKQYPPGMPRTVNVKQYQNIPDMLIQFCNQYRQRVAFSHFGSDLSYASFVRRSERLAIAWQQVGLQPGDRIAIMLPNCFQYPIALFAAFLAGLVVVNVNPQQTEEELMHQLSDSQVTALLVLDTFLPSLTMLLPLLPISHVFTSKLGDCIGGLKSVWLNYLSHKGSSLRRKIPSEWEGVSYEWRQLMVLGKRHELRRVRADLDDLALVQYTAATTGQPKGVMLTHQNIIANVIQLLTWIRPAFDLGDSVISLQVLPFHNTMSMTGGFFAVMGLGFRSLLVMDTLQHRKLTRLFQKEAVGLFIGTNTLFKRLLSDPEFQYANFTQLKLVVAGGMVTHLTVADRWARVTGVSVVEGYGLTEASPVVAANPVTRSHEQFNSSAGLALPNTDIKIVDSQGLMLPFDRVGEICVRGPQVTALGYWNRPDQTAALYDSDGFLKTGDMGRVDEQGFLYVVERKQDVISVSGFSVYPGDVEEVLVAHPAVSEVSVVGLPDAKGSYRVVAVVVLRPGRVFDEKALLTYCREKLIPYKVPAIILNWPSLPKSTVGKVLRRQLRDSLRPKAGGNVEKQ